MNITKLHLTLLPMALALFVPQMSFGADSAPPASGDTVQVTIQANDQMKYDTASIQAKPGQSVQITLRNVGTMPKVSMGHNFVILDGQVPAEQFLEASQMQMANDYVAPEMKEHVIAHTKLLGPGESDTITFTAPKTPGDYPFLCSFPGHYAIGMKGVFSVK